MVSFHEIKLPKRVSLNSEIVGFFTYFKAELTKDVVTHGVMPHGMMRAMWMPHNMMGVMPCNALKIP